MNHNTMKDFFFSLKYYTFDLNNSLDGYTIMDEMNNLLQPASLPSCNEDFKCVYSLHFNSVSIERIKAVATLFIRQIRSKLIYIHPRGPLPTFHLNNLNIQKSRRLLPTDISLNPPVKSEIINVFIFQDGKYLPLFEVWILTISVTLSIF